jgi:hypothetical protein
LEFLFTGSTGSFAAPAAASDTACAALEILVMLENPDRTRKYFRTQAGNISTRGPDVEGGGDDGKELGL